MYVCRLAELDVSHNSLTVVPSAVFQLPELANLQLSYNLLTHLPGDPEDPSAETHTGVSFNSVPATSGTSTCS